MGIEEDRGEERISSTKSVLFMERKRRTRLVVRMIWRGVEQKQKREWRDGQKGKGQWSQWPK